MTHQAHITDYRILSETEHTKLATLVEVKIGDGWQPFGPLAVSTIATESGMPISNYVQAMVKQSEWFR